MDIYAYHTDDGAPMNETALCTVHMRQSDWRDAATAAMDAADDKPTEPDYRKVEHPEHNDTVCIACGHSH